MHVPFAFSKAGMDKANLATPVTIPLKKKVLFCFEGVASYIVMPHPISNLMRYHLYLNFNGKAVKTIKPFSENQLCGIICQGVYICIALCRLCVDPILFCVDSV